MSGETNPDRHPAGPRWKTTHTIGLIGIGLGIAVVGYFVPASQRLWAWVAVLAFIVLSVALVGNGIEGFPRGILIDGRNKVSLSRLQIVIWTILVLSAFLTAALGNVAAGSSSPLSVTIPGELWALMGISTTSLVASPLVLGTKRSRAGSPDDLERTRARMAATGVDPQRLHARGQVVHYSEPADSRWSDVMRGEEVGNAAQLDLAKIQMLYFTLALAIAYAVALARMFADDGMVMGLPALPEGIVVLLGISHAGYLTYKAVPHTSDSGTGVGPHSESEIRRRREIGERDDVEFTP